MASYNTEPRNCTVSGKITERLQNKMQGIFIRSGDTLNFSEQIYRALETWTAEHNSNVDVIVIQNRKKLLNLELNDVYEDANSLISGDILMENCLKFAVILRTHPKQFNKSTHLKDFAGIICKTKVISQEYYNYIVKEVLLLLNNTQKSILKLEINRYTVNPDIPINYTGGTLDNDTPESEILELANNCMTVPIQNGLREKKIQDTIFYIASKYPDKISDYEVCFMNAIEQLESKRA